MTIMKKELVYSLTFISIQMAWAIVTFAASGYNTAELNQKLRDTVHKDSEMEIIRARVISELMAPEVEQSRIEYLLDAIRDDGSWPDIDYEDVSRTGWEHRFHLEHIGDLSRAYKKPESAYFQNPKVKKAIFSALRFWFEHNFKCENWYFNVIRTPREITRILLLMDSDLTDALKEDGLRLSQWADPSAVTHNIGGDEIKVAGIHAKRALFLRNEQLLKESIEMMNENIHITTVQGIQPDMSFHHRSFAINSTTTYGIKTPQHFGRWAAHFAGTRFAFPKQKIELVVDFFLDGVTRSLVHGSQWDPGTFDRAISRNTEQLEDSRPGLLSPDIPRNLLAATSYRRAELEESLSVRMGEKQPEYAHSYFFWRSEYYSHQRPNYFASARMYSSRSYNVDRPYNSEGIKNHHLGDGANFISRTGQEYRDIYPVYDWQKIPGTTVVQKPSLPSPDEITKAGHSDFVGGVTDGMYGAAALDFVSPHDPLAARKAWFFFDEELVSLGAGISSDGEYPVATTLNQCLLNREVVVSTKDGWLNMQQGDHDLKSVLWIHHDRIAYVFPDTQNIRLSNKRASGTWRSINQQQWATDEEVQEDVFKLWVDHGHTPSQEKYAYIVVPGIDVAQVKRYRENTRINILANTPVMQAVEHTGLQIAQIAFYETGEIELAGGMKVRAESPGLVMVHMSGESIKKLTIADPTWKLDSFRLRITSKIEGRGERWTAVWNESGGYSDIQVELPSTEGYAGKSIIIIPD
jgi:chondroitin AC lyase